MICLKLIVGYYISKNKIFKRDKKITKAMVIKVMNTLSKKTGSLK